MAGTNVRDWYYMLRDLDPTARRYRAVVLGVTNYDDVDEYYSPPDDIRSLYYAAVRLRWSDTLEFARSFDKRELQWQALRGGLLKGLVLHKDILDFLADIGKRMKVVEASGAHYEEWTYNYVETERDMRGLQIDWATRAVTFQPGMNQDQVDTVKGQTGETAPQIGRLARYRRLWLGRILDHYRGSATKIMFVRLPRGPIPRPDALQPPAGSVIRQLAARPNVVVVDEHRFEGLERPELFRDGLHLNRAGIERFSPEIAVEIAHRLP